MDAQKIGKFVRFGSLALAATVLSVSVASAESFTLRIGSGQPMKPLEPIFKADNFFAPTVSKRVAAETKHKIKFVKLWNTVVGPFDGQRAADEAAAVAHNAQPHAA